MGPRNVLIVALVALASAPVCMLLFGGGDQAAGARQTPAPVHATARATATSECVERTLTYGLTNDQAQADQLAKDFLSPLVVHPPLPHPGFYAPGRAPDQGALFHALYHGYVVVRYRPELAGAVRHALRAAVGGAAQPVVVVAGSGMPFAAGAVVYGRTSLCATFDRAAAVQLAAWVRDARSGQSVP
jgi:hypothetical protein